MTETGTIGKIRRAFGSFRNERESAEMSTMNLASVTEQVTRFNLVPTSDNYDSIIFEATLLVRDDAIFWSPDSRWTPDCSERDDCTWISAKQLRWREVDWLGEELHYGPEEEDSEKGNCP